MPCPVVRQQGGIGGRGVAKVQELSDVNCVVFHFAVEGQSVVEEPALAADAEPGEGRSSLGPGRNLNTQIIRTCNERLADEDLLSRIGPVAVAVEIDPGIQFGCRRGDDLHGGRPATIQRCGEPNAVFVIVIGKIIPLCVRFRQAVRLSVALGTQGWADGVVACTVIGQERWIQGGGRVAEIDFGGKFRTHQRRDSAAGLGERVDHCRAAVCQTDFVQLVRAACGPHHAVGAVVHVPRAHVGGQCPPERCGAG